MTSQSEHSGWRITFLVSCAVGLCGGSELSAQDAGERPGKKNDEPRVLWKYAPGGARFSEVLVGKGLVLALDREGKIHALESPTGEVRWVREGGFGFDYGFGFTLSTDPEFDALLIGCDSGLFALDRATGEELWHTPIALGLAGPAVAQQVVVAGAADGKVYGCELKTGKILWEHDYLEDQPDDPEGFSGASARLGDRPARPGDAATDGKMVALPIFDQCRVLALDAKTGKRLWAFQTQGWVYGQPTIGPRFVYAASQDKHFYAIDKELGKAAWTVKTRARNEAAAAFTDRFVYFGSCDANLYAVDNGVGKVRWKYETERRERRGGPIYSRPVVLGKVVYLAAMNGKVYAVHRETGELIWKFCPLPDSEPNSDLVEAGGLLFLTTRKDGDEGESAVLAITVR